jgi:hypothetical protein
MGIGLVDPILPVLAQDPDATPSQVSMLFTSYFAITGVAMLVTGFVASRLDAKRTLLGGLALVIMFSALAGVSGTVAQIAGFRAGWGLGNALFIATALAVIVGAASGGVGGAIMLYEAALGLGIASGPLVGARRAPACGRRPRRHRPRRARSRGRGRRGRRDARRGPPPSPLAHAQPLRPRRRGDRRRAGGGGGVDVRRCWTPPTG